MDHRKPVAHTAPGNLRQPATITADLAIFTSIRTPMGEGYRIVAASSGVKPEEKQCITRNSPSHGALCAEDEEGAAPEGCSFYALPSGRYCIAHSQPAGAEHTGRGGARIYTVNAILSEGDLAAFGYNPFAVLRSLKATDAVVPQLKPPPRLDPVALPISTHVEACRQARFHPAIDSAVRLDALAGLLVDRSLILDVEGEWIESAEAMILGLPGPMRLQVSIGAGLTFSVARPHRIQFLHDGTPQTETRVAGQPIQYRRVKPGAAVETNAAGTQTPWALFVELHWACGQFGRLAERTSLPFPDVTPGGRDRIGQLYLAWDAIPDATTAEVLAIANDYLPSQMHAVEQSIADNVIKAAGASLAHRFATEPWSELGKLWHTVAAQWRSGPRGTDFAQPLIDATLRRLSSLDPLACLEAMFVVARDVPSQAEDHQGLVDATLVSLADWAEEQTEVDAERFKTTCDQWEHFAPSHEQVARLSRRRDELLAVGSDTNT